MVVRRIIISAALLCILPLPFSSSLITDSAPTTLVLGAPPVHLLTSHAPSSSAASSSSSSSSSASASSLDHAKFASSDNKRDLHHHSPANSASTTAARRNLKKRVTAKNNHIKSIYNPPPPPKNMVEFKKCFHECITQTQEMYPECKGSVSSNPATDREGSEYMTWQNLCPLASLVCLHYCKLQDCDWGKWIDAVDQGLMQSGGVVV